MKALIIMIDDEYHGMNVLTVSNDGNVRENEALVDKLWETNLWWANSVEKVLRELKLWDKYKEVYHYISGTITKIK